MNLRLPMLLLWLPLAACHAIAGYDPAQAGDGARLIDALDIDSSDARLFDGNIDGSPPDGGIDGRIDTSFDLLRYVDSRALTPPPPCTFVSTPEDAIWVHRFDAPAGLASPLPAALPAEVGTPLQLIGNAISRVRGPGSCGEALAFDSTSDSYAVIDDDLRLVEGAISLWVRFAGDGRLEGILSRDRTQSNEPGHLTLMRTVGGHIVLRLQTTETSVPSQQDLLCSASTAPSGSWHHIRVAFGGGRAATLEVNGDDELHQGGLSMESGMLWECTKKPQIRHGIEGAPFPLVVGATLMYWSGSGELDVRKHLHGAVDELVISGRRLRR